MNAFNFNIMNIIIGGEHLKNIFLKTRILTMNAFNFNIMNIIIGGEHLKKYFYKKNNFNNVRLQF